MKLLSVIPAATTKVFRTLHCSGTAEEFPVGEHAVWDGFGIKLTNVTIIPDSAKDAAPGQFYVSIEGNMDWSLNFEAINTLSPEYMAWCGKYTPNIEDVLGAHIIKGQLPDLPQDFDKFVEDFRGKIAKVTALKEGRMTFIGSTMDDTETKAKYDLWAIYKHHLMLDGQMVLHYGQDNYVHIADTHVSEKGVAWWLNHHNEQMMGMAEANDLLAAYITFGREDAAYTFVAPDGTQVKRPVEYNEFMHLAHHGKFPSVVVHNNPEENHFSLTIDSIEHFPKAYHDFVNATGHSGRSLDLVRFV